jgi:hypothetical protein
VSEAPGVLAAVDGILEEDGDPDDALREVVSALVEHGCRWAGILFAEGGELVLGPEAGTPSPDGRAHTPVVYEGARVAELVTDGCDDQALLEQVAARISTHCLVGWDTGGTPWEEATG